MSFLCVVVDDDAEVTKKKTIVCGLSFSSSSSSFEGISPPLFLRVCVGVVLRVFSINASHSLDTRLPKL